MESGSEYGMQTLEQALADLLRQGTITMEVARSISENPKALEQRLRASPRPALGGT